MGYCKKCFEHIRNDCLLTNDICVFCYYKTNEWDSNGQLVKKKDVIVNWEKSFLTLRDYYKEYHEDITRAIKNLPKGSIHQKRIKGHLYYYLVYRNRNKKVISKYAGKNAKELKNKTKLRQNLEKKLLKTRPLLYSLKIITRPVKQINKFEIFKRDKFTCQYCGRRPKDGIKLVIDHIIPLSKGGTHNKRNLTTSCSECNSMKHDKFIK